MKKIFTLCCALLGLASAVNAATVDDIKVCKHSYVLVCDDYTNDGTGKRVAGTLFGDGFFLDVTGGSVATNKGNSDPGEVTAAVTDSTGAITTPAAYRYDSIFAKKYAEYGSHLNSLRLKNTQDVIAMKVTAGSKLIFLLQGNNKSGTAARFPKIATDKDLKNALNDAPTADFPATPAGFYYEWTAKDDYTLYIGSYNGDMFLGYIIVEAKEAPGTPTVKVGAQTYADGLYYREVICKANTVVEEGSTEEVPTLVTYTTDGSTPDEKSPVYTEPIKCYSNQTVKFQAYMNLDGKASKDFICEGADNEASVSFQFNAPAIAADGANVTVTSAYDGAKNYVSYLDKADVESSAITLTESATVTAYSKIVNGTYATFTTKSTEKDVYVLNPLKTEKTIAITAGEAKDSLDASGNAVYYVENGAISTDKMDFFVKNLEFGVVTSKVDSIKKYQIDEKEVYIKMNNTNITFLVDEKDSVDVVVTCSKNACKNVYASDSTQWQCYVAVDAATYGGFLFDRADQANLDAYKNVINFSLGAGIHTFKKYSGTGNILISSIKITPRLNVAIKELVSEKKAVAVKKAMVNGRLVIKTANGTFNAAGVRVE